MVEEAVGQAVEKVESRVERLFEEFFHTSLVKQAARCDGDFDEDAPQILQESDWESLSANVFPKLVLKEEG